MNLRIPYVIAEIGSNWHTKGDCLAQIKLARECDAAAVKFQVYTHEDLYGYPGDSKSLPIEWIPELSGLAKQLGLDFICSSFAPNTLTEIDKYCDAHKIASCECHHAGLILEALKSQKPVFISYGCEDKTTIPMIANTNVIPMECVAAYPADISDYALGYLSYKTHRGLSDHTMDNKLACYAVANGYQYFEKHFNGLGVTHTDDSPHSLSLEQFKSYVLEINEVHNLIVRPKAVRKSEQSIAMYSKRRNTEHGFYRTKQP